MSVSGDDPKDPLEESTLDSERVFDGVLLKVQRDRVRLPVAARV